MAGDGESVNGTVALEDALKVCADVVRIGRGLRLTGKCGDNCWGNVGERRSCVMVALGSTGEARSVEGGKSTAGCTHMITGASGGALAAALGTGMGPSGIRSRRRGGRRACRRQRREMGKGAHGRGPVAKKLAVDGSRVVKTSVVSKLGATTLLDELVNPIKGLTRGIVLESMAAALSKRRGERRKAEKETRNINKACRPQAKHNGRVNIHGESVKTRRNK